MSDSCPKCGADARNENAIYWTAFECNSSEPTETGKLVPNTFLSEFHQSEPCRIRQLEGLLRRVPDDDRLLDYQLLDDIRNALREAPK